MTRMCGTAALRSAGPQVGLSFKCTRWHGSDNPAMTQVPGHVSCHSACACYGRLTRLDTRAAYLMPWSAPVPIAGLVKPRTYRDSVALMVLSSALSDTPG